MKKIVIKSNSIYKVKCDLKTREDIEVLVNEKFPFLKHDEISVEYYLGPESYERIMTFLEFSKIYLGFVEKYKRNKKCTELGFIYL